MKLFLCHRCSVTQLCPTLQPHGLQHTKVLVLHYVPEFAQIHVHWVGDVIQPSHPLSSLSLALDLSQHQGSFPVSRLFASGGQSIEVWASTSVLPKNIQGWFPLELTGLISLQTHNPILSREEQLCYMAKNKDIRSREVLAHTHTKSIWTPPFPLLTAHCTNTLSMLCSHPFVLRTEPSHSELIVTKIWLKEQYLLLILPFQAGANILNQGKEDTHWHFGHFWAWDRKLLNPWRNESENLLSAQVATISGFSALTIKLLC